MNKRPILKLNQSYFPLGTSTWEDTIVNIFSGSAHPLDIVYAENEDGTLDESTIEYFNVIKNWKDWSKLPIRSCDDYVHTTSGPARLPSIVLCARFNRVIFKTVQFPTNQNIFKRDKFTCGYTGRKLQKHELSVDHILPVSRGGKNEWTNMITCTKLVNTFKDNRLPHECGLKLLWKPEKPVNGLVFDNMRDDWAMFLGATK
jgi:5-methylcytosine-specific restriction endonuclease McrA